MGGEHHAKARPLDALPELLEGDRLRGRAVAGEIVDQRTQALQIGSAPGLAQVAAQALRPTRESLDREPLDQLLDHRRRQRAGIHSLLDRQREQLDGIARRVGVSAPAQARQGGLQLGQQRIDRIIHRRRRRRLPRAQMHAVRHPGPPPTGPRPALPAGDARWCYGCVALARAPMLSSVPLRQESCQGDGAAWQWLVTNWPKLRQSSCRPSWAS